MLEPIGGRGLVCGIVRLTQLCRYRKAPKRGRSVLIEKAPISMLKTLVYFRRTFLATSWALLARYSCSDASAKR